MNIMKRCWLNKKSPGNFSFLIVVVKNKNDKAEFTMLESEFSLAWMSQLTRFFASVYPS